MTSDAQVIGAKIVKRSIPQLADLLADGEKVLVVPAEAVLYKPLADDEIH